MRDHDTIVMSRPARAIFNPAAVRANLDLVHRTAPGARVLAIVEQMDRHIEHPLELAALARSAGITRRQMERLFDVHLAIGPAAYYRGLRLERARTLVRDTDLALIEVAMATGFTSDSSLSRAYRQRFDRSPSTDRLPMSHAFKHHLAG